MFIRVLNNLAGERIDHRPGDVIEVSDRAGQALYDTRAAIPEGPSPSGAIASLYESAGYVHLAVDPSGFRRVNDGSFLADAPVAGGFYFNTAYRFTVCYPGKREVSFDLLKLHHITER